MFADFQSLQGLSKIVLNYQSGESLGKKVIRDAFLSCDPFYTLT